jgi:putative GTP pyrophosphokinase
MGLLSNLISLLVKPPWESKGRLNRAGDNLRVKTLTSDDIRVLDAWRGAHNHVLNTFQAILRNRTKGKNIIVAQRLKRRLTITDKLFQSQGCSLPAWMMLLAVV